jgi:hypothetical protein
VIFDAIYDNVATRADVQASEAALRGLVAGEVAHLDTRIERLDGKVEMLSLADLQPPRRSNGRCRRRAVRRSSCVAAALMTRVSPRY